MEETEAQGVPSPVRLAFRVAYFGENFMGSQLQPGLRTVEGEFIAACMRLGLFTDWRDAGFASSGRTDRGVHALGQVMAFTTAYPERAIETLNLQLPPDLWCRSYALVSSGFHPRYDARWRTYRYYFREEGLDMDAMNAVAALFEGVHDFAGFAKVSGKNPIRTVLSASVSREDGIVYFEVTAQSYLWHMVRCMAKALINAGTGASCAGEIEKRLYGTCEKGLHPAPPEGLVLWDVGYGIPWRRMAEGERRLAEIKGLKGYYHVMDHICEVFQKPHEYLLWEHSPEEGNYNNDITEKNTMPVPRYEGSDE
ncbi:MAG TPA: tRNA pseudouridine(38-40) synthase TruA [Methanoregulaceae archaeon]|nr:tRNA pseudouridine(38-40) synthase TruA [Methanoregulaceae archaeon]